MVIFCEASVSICVGPRRPTAALYVGPPRSLCWVPALSRSLQQAPALSVSGPGLFCGGPALSASSPGALCVGCRCSLRRAPALPGALWVEARRSLRRASALSLSASGPGALSLSVSGSVSAPGTLLPLSVSGPDALCVGPALSASPSVLCVGPRRSLCHAPALSVSGPAALSLSVSALSVLGPGGPLPALSASSPAALRRSLCRGPALSVSLCHPPQLGSACHPSGPAGPQLRSACHPSSPARSLFPGGNLKPYCLGEKHTCKLQTCF